MSLLEMLHYVFTSAGIAFLQLVAVHLMRAAKRPQSLFKMTDELSNAAPRVPQGAEDERIQARERDQRSFRSFLIRGWLTYTPARGFHLSKARG